MVQVERSFTVARPIDDVVGYLRDFAHAESWDPGTKSCTRVDDGPVAVGATWHNISIFRGRETELTYRLTLLEPRHLIFHGENKTATSTDDLTFTPTDEHTTEITYRATIDFHGLARLADPFLRPEFNRLGNETATQMTTVLNAL